MNLKEIKETILNAVGIETLYNTECNHTFGGTSTNGNGFSKKPCCCPLHTEKKPSFSVNLTNGIFNCQGCGEHGDFFDLIRKIHGYSYPDALRYAANQHGIDVENLKPFTEVDKQRLRDREAERKKQTKKDTESAILKTQSDSLTLIASCAPYDGSGHDYIQKKGITACEGVLCLKKELVLPFFDINGVVWNAQRILPKKITLKNGNSTDKLFVKGSFQPGIFFTIPGNEKFGYTEGFSTGMSVHLATGRTVLVCGMSWNCENVVSANLEQNPEADHCFFSDNEWWKSEKENAGHRTGQKVRKLGVNVLYPVFEDEDDEENKRKDFNDYHQKYGLDGLKRFIESGTHEQPLEKPEIWIAKGKLPEMTDQAEAAVIGAKYNLYQQGGELKKLGMIKTVNSKKIDYPDSLVMITNVLSAYVREAFARCASWIQPVKIPKSNPPEFTSEPANPPKDSVEIYMARAERNLLPLSGIIYTPMLLSDGSVLQKPGYDKKTGFYYHKTLNIRIPKNPTLEDAKTALEILKQPIRYFPFEDRASLSVALAAVLTALNRKAWDNAPLFAFNSPTPRTGKGNLCKYISLISTGESPVLIDMVDARDDGDEFKKTISGPIMRGSPVISIDNVPDRISIRSEFLCRCLTEKVIDPRVLATNNNPRCPTNLTFLANGNNLQIGSDMQGRTLICTIDTGLERPENRKFDFDVSEFCLDHRAELVTAGLTVLRAFLISGANPEIPVWGSFVQWSNWVRKALVWCGEEDPYTANEKARQDDPDIILIKRLLIAWEDYYGGLEKKTVKQILSEADVPDKEDNETKTAFDDVIWEICNPKAKKPLGKQLGEFLTRFKGRVFNGLRLITAKKNNPKDTHPNKWQIERAVKGDFGF